MNAADAPSAAFSDSRPHYVVLDGLRGVAALVVLGFHVFEAFATSPFDQKFNHGYLAVDFFFMLSGFVIGYAYDARGAGTRGVVERGGFLFRAKVARDLSGGAFAAPRADQRVELVRRQRRRAAGIQGNRVRERRFFRRGSAPRDQSRRRDAPSRGNAARRGAGRRGHAVARSAPSSRERPPRRENTRPQPAATTPPTSSRTRGNASKKSSRRSRFRSSR